MANENGNFTLMLVTMFSVAAPNYAIYKGGSFATSFFFYYLLAFYGLCFFTQHLTVSPTQQRKPVRHAANHNETHYSALVLGLLLGLAAKKRLK